MCLGGRVFFFEFSLGGNDPKGHFESTLVLFQIPVKWPDKA